MYHYLFTNDLRVSELEVKLRETSQYIHDDNIPSAQENKSLNNNINTLMFYFESTLPTTNKISSQ